VGVEVVEIMGIVVDAVVVAVAVVTGILEVVDAATAVVVVTAGWVVVDDVVPQPERTKITSNRIIRGINNLFILLLLFFIYFRKNSISTVIVYFLPGIPLS